MRHWDIHLQLLDYPGWKLQGFPARTDCRICSRIPSKIDIVAPSKKNARYIAGGIYLGIDPFFYFESLFKMADMPPLIYT